MINNKFVSIMNPFIENIPDSITYLLPWTLLVLLSYTFTYILCNKKGYGHEPKTPRELVNSIIRTSALSVLIYYVSNMSNLELNWWILIYCGIIIVTPLLFSYIGQFKGLIVFFITRILFIVYLE